MFRLVRRAAVLVAALVCTALPVQAQSSPTDLARGLRDNGMPDLALEYLDELAKGNPKPDVLAVLPLERARARLELANDEPDRGKRDALIAKARSEFDQFLKANANHPRFAEAAISLARLLSVQAKGMLSEANKIDETKARKAAAAKARPVFTDASTRFGQAAVEYAKKADDPALTATQKRAVLADVYQAELDRALNQFQLARTYDPPEVAEVVVRGKVIDDAKKLFNDLANKDLSSPTCWLAKAWTGECDREKDAPVDAQKIFDGVKLAATKFPPAAAGARLVRFFEARIEYENAFAAKTTAAFKKAQTSLEQWLSDPSSRGRRPAPEVYAARFYVAVCKDRQGRFQVKVDDKTKAVTLLPGAVDLLKQAEKDYKRLIEPENDYSGRSAERHTQVLLLLIGDGEKNPASIANFEEALMSAKVQLYKAMKEKDVDQKKLMMKASAFYERAITLPVPKDMARDLIDAQTNLAFTYLMAGRPMEAAVLAENIAKTTRQAGPGARAGLYGVQSYLQAAQKLEPDDNTGRRVDTARATRLAYYLDKQFPTDPNTDAARVTLGNLLVRDQKYIDAFEVASRVGSGSPKAPNARLVQGVAAFELLRPVPAEAEVKPETDITPQKKAEINQRVMADFQSLPVPAASAPADAAYLSGTLGILHVELHLLNKPDGYPKGEALAKTEQVRVNAFTDLTDDEKAEFKFKFEHARLRAIYGQAIPLFQTGRYAEVNQKIGPPLGEIAKDGPASKAGQAPTLAAAAKKLDDFRREALIVLALQTRIREGAVDKAGELFVLLKTLGGTLDNSVDALGQLIAAAKPQIDNLRKDGKTEEADKITAGIGIVLDKVAAEPNISTKVLLFLGSGLRDMGNYEKAAETLKKIPVPDAKLLDKKIAELDEKTERLPVLFYRRSQLELARTYRMGKQFAEADATLKAPMGTKEKPGWAANAPDFRKEVAFLLEAKGANAADSKEALKFWGEARQKWNEIANEQYKPLSKLGAGKKDARSAFIALLDLKALPPDKNLPVKVAKEGEKPELDEKEIRAVIANPKPGPKQQWLNKLLTEKELDETGKPMKGADGKELDPPYVVQLKNTVTRFDAQLKPQYHELYYESTRCLVRANAQVLKDKPAELATQYGKIAKSIHSLYEANPDLTPEIREKFEALLNEHDGALRKEYAKLGDVKTLVPPREGETSTASAEPKAAEKPAEPKSDSSGLMIGAVAGVICLVGIGGYVVFSRKKKAPSRRGPPTMTLDAE